MSDFEQMLLKKLEKKIDSFRKKSDTPKIKMLFWKKKLKKGEVKNVSIIVFDGDDVVLDSCSEPKILLCQKASNGPLVIPKVKITVEKDLSEEKTTENLLIKSFKYFEYFYDIRYVSCCKNKVFRINDRICFILGPGEWKGSAKMPLPPIYPSFFSSLFWFDVKKAAYDKDYVDSLNIGKETFDIIRNILIKTNQPLIS